MRRLAALLLLAAAVAPAGFALAFEEADSAAKRCAIACGHGLRERGAICCPVGGSSGAPAWTACPRGESVAVRALTGPAEILSAERFVPPGGWRHVDALPPHRILSAFAVPPEHVPLSLF